MNTLEINSKILILSVQEREKVNVYTFVDLSNNQTQSYVSVKKEVALHTVWNAKISVRFNREVLNLQDGTKKYLTSAVFFIVNLEEGNK